MAWVGQGIAFAGLALSAAWMEINGISAAGLWFLLAFWAAVTEWHPKQ